MQPGDGDAALALLADAEVAEQATRFSASSPTGAANSKASSPLDVAIAAVRGHELFRTSLLTEAGTRSPQGGPCMGAAASRALTVAHRPRHPPWSRMVIPPRPSGETGSSSCHHRPHCIARIVTGQTSLPHQFCYPPRYSNGRQHGQEDREGSTR